MAGRFGGLPAVRALRAAAEVREGGGLLVQFTLERRVTEGEPAAPDAPGVWQLRGTVAPWHPDEPRTHPAGRLLVPHGRIGDARGNPCTVRVSPAGVSFNWPFTEGNRPPDAGREPGVVELRTARSDLLVAVLPDGVPDGPSGGGTVVSVPADSPEAVSRAEQEGLVLVRAAHGTGAATVLLRERETVVLTDEACLILEHPDAERGDEHAVEVPVRTFLRGRPRRSTPSSSASTPIRVPCRWIRSPRRRRPAAGTWRWYGSGRAGPPGRSP